MKALVYPQLSIMSAACGGNAVDADFKNVSAYATLTANRTVHLLWSFAVIGAPIASLCQEAQLTRALNLYSSLPPQLDFLRPVAAALVYVCLAAA